MPPRQPPATHHTHDGWALRFSAFGFPVRIEASFFLIVALIGFGGSATDLAIWIGMALVAVLGHELGHAFAARRLGAAAAITLQGMGGVTRSTRAMPLSRAESAVLSAAGPAAGILLGLPVLLADRSLAWPSWTTGGYALRVAAFTTLGWSVLNLLPVLPLDGGHLLELALPGGDVERRRMAARVSIAIAAAGGIAAYRGGEVYIGLLAILFASQNFATLKQLAASDHRQEAAGGLEEAAERHDRGDYAAAAEIATRVADDPGTPDDLGRTARRLAVIALTEDGRAGEALTQLDRLPSTAEFDALRGWVIAAGGDVDAGVRQAEAACAAHPGAGAASWLVETLARAGRHDDAARVVGAYAGELPVTTMQRALLAAYRAGRFDAAGRIGDAAGPTGAVTAAGVPDPARASVAYNAACSWSRAGDMPAAFASLRRALALGWADVDQLDRDDDLAPLRRHPDWAEVRAGA